MIPNGGGARARNEGAYLLARVGLTDAEIADRTSLERAQVTKYRLAQLKPRKGNRLVLLREFGISVEAWDRPVELAASTPATTSNGGLVSAAEVHAILGELVRGLKDKLGKATPYETAKVLKSTASTLQSLDKLMGGAVTEQKILQSTAWRDMKGRMLDALRPWPDALSAIGKVLVEPLDGDP
jgi:hypothetical protein